MMCCQGKAHCGQCACQSSQQHNCDHKLNGLYCVEGLRGKGPGGESQWADQSTDGLCAWVFALVCQSCQSARTSLCCSTVLRLPQGTNQRSLSAALHLAMACPLPACSSVSLTTVLLLGNACQFHILFA